MTRSTVPQGLDGHGLDRSSFEARMQPSGCMLAPQDDGQMFTLQGDPI